MSTPILMLILLTLPWFVTMVATRRPEWRRWGGVVGVALVFAFTGIGHFVKTEPMARMMPEAIPWRHEIVLVSGVLELALAVLVLVPGPRREVGLGIAVLLVLLLPINVHAAISRIPMGGHAWGPVYLLIRVPLQLILIAWTYVFLVRAHARDRA
ncbi:hypothetical protein Pan216_38480 [Planctomycetes bacterium Pan216]|uniref:DoxX n=1 Tax=Kolteria novifilia TaxID=2527975 RepID=A0A518B7M2_9BACT|nr:hypothetical protein Pan216_38480 [Planctomycetes bacterium Pan216]